MSSTFLHNLPEALAVMETRTMMGYKYFLVFFKKSPCNYQVLEPLHEMQPDEKIKKTCNNLILYTGCETTGRLLVVPAAL